MERVNCPMCRANVGDGAVRNLMDSGTMSDELMEITNENRNPAEPIVQPIIVEDAGAIHDGGAATDAADDEIGVADVALAVFRLFILVICFKPAVNRFVRGLWGVSEQCIKFIFKTDCFRRH